LYGLGDRVIGVGKILNRSTLKEKKVVLVEAANNLGLYSGPPFNLSIFAALSLSSSGETIRVNNACNMEGQTIKLFGTGLYSGNSDIQRSSKVGTD
jgi:hypothetical protein